MNSKFSNVNFYCSNIRDEEQDEKQCLSRFLHFGSSFVEVESNAGAALTVFISSVSPIIKLSNVLREVLDHTCFSVTRLIITVIFSLV